MATKSLKCCGLEIELFYGKSGEVTTISSGDVFYSSVDPEGTYHFVLLFEKLMYEYCGNESNVLLMFGAEMEEAEAYCDAVKQETMISKASHPSTVQPAQKKGL